MVPDGLSVRGRELWGSASTGEPGADGLVLEACRILDRLDVLDDMIQAGDVSVLSEARQQQATLAKLVDAIGKARPSQGRPGKPATGGGENVTPLDVLRRELAG